MEAALQQFDRSLTRISFINEPKLAEIKDISHILEKFEDLDILKLESLSLKRLSQFPSLSNLTKVTNSKTRKDVFDNLRKFIQTSYIYINISVAFFSG